MATFDTLIDDLAGRYGLGANARSLIKEALTMISSSSGGLGGFLDTFKSAGLTSEVASWLGHPNAGPITAGQVERALGATALGGIAGRLGLAQSVVSTALGYALPKIVGLLTPGGVIPAGVPAEVTGFLSQPRAAAATEQVTPRRVDVYPASAQNQSGVRRWLWPALAALVVVLLLSYFWSTLNRMPSAPPVTKAPEPATPAPSTVAQAPSPPPAPSPAAQAPAAPPSAPTAAQTPAPAPQPAAQPPAPAPSTEAQATASQASPPPPASASSAGAQATAPPPPAPVPSTQAQATTPQASPLPAAQAPAAPTSPPTTEQTPATPAPAAVATAEPTAPASVATPTRLALSNDNGVVRASGAVRDEDAKTSILNALNAVFSADKVKSDISVDKSAAAVSWLGNIRAALEALKGPNVDAIFEGDKVNVGGSAMGDAARDKIIAALKSALGASVAVGALSDKTAAAVAIANDGATTELASRTAYQMQ